MDLRLRRAEPADATSVAGILIGVRRAFMPYAPAAHSDDEIHRWVAQRLVPSGGVTVAEAEGRVVGVMASETADEQVWICQMAVHPDLVGHGIGSTLLAHGLRAWDRPIRLWTFQANTGARRFYERHGFVALAFTDGQANEERCPDVLYGLDHRGAGGGHP